MKMKKKRGNDSNYLIPSEQQNKALKKRIHYFKKIIPAKGPCWY